MKKQTIGIIAAILALSAPLVIVGCTPKDTPIATELTEIKVSLPSSIDVVKGEDAVISTPKSGVKTSDRILLEKDGKLTYCDITNADDNGFAFRIPDNFVSGSYKFTVRSGERKVAVGTIYINLVSSRIKIEEGTTVYGIVETADGPIANVVVSDGKITTLTNAKGEYQLKSDKESGFVFISIPSGYECEVNGVFPDHYRTLSSNLAPENKSFKLKKVDQSRYKVLFFGDIHAANRSANGDMGQFKTVCNDINSYVKAHASERIYAVTLGDMTWDLYWYTSKFAPSDYKKTINENISGLPIFHTIGNHDNDMRAFGNFAAKSPFKEALAPPYYSFNIGGVHYVVLDNVDCSAYVGDENRDNQVAGKLYNPELEWLAADLKYVSKDTPVLVMMHVPVFDSSAPGTFKKTMRDADALMSALSGYNVHFITGHTHRNYNVVPEDAVTGGRNVYEHNMSALCADWWWSGKLTPGLLQSTDGTPSGYGVWDINGKDIKYLYKCAGKDENFQFRSYDLNNVKFSMSDVPLLVNSNLRTLFSNIISGYTGAQNNEVLINVWAKNNRWKVEVKTTDGKVLPVTPCSAYDPIQIMAQSVKRFNEASLSSEPIGTVQKRHHFYKVAAPDANTDLIITVTDEFGRNYTETMERPKKFDVETYKIVLK